MRDNRKQKNHRLANRQTLVFRAQIGELDAHEPCAKQEKGEDQAGLALEEKGRADEEPEDGHRHGPAFRYRGHPSKHTKDREHLFSDQPTHPADPDLLYFPERTTDHGGPFEEGRGARGNSNSTSQTS